MSEQPEPIVFFTDRDLGKQFPNVLEQAGLVVERLDDLFPPDTPDDVWLEYVATHRRVAISHDARIRWKPNELEAVIEHRVALLIVVGRAPHRELALNFVNMLPKVMRFPARHNPPFIAKVHRPSPSDLAKNPNALGFIKLWYPRE